jgi:hypothetical protein
MRNLFTFLVLITGLAVVAQQKSFTIIDASSKESIPYASVNLLNSYGIYADENGFVILANETDEIELSCLGYETKKVKVNDINKEVFLSPKPIELDEVEIVAAVKKVKKGEEEVKAIGHQNVKYMCRSSIGRQYAFLVKRKEDNSYLSRISLPLMKKDLVIPPLGSKEDPFKKKPYKSVLKIEIVENTDGMPGEMFNDFEQVVVIDSNAGKLFDITLDREIPVPAEGFFVRLTILGNADENGKLMSEFPYVILTNTNGSKDFRNKSIQPNFSLVEKPKGVETFVKWGFRNDCWEQIEKPLLVDPDKKYNGFNIGFGYTLVLYK